MISIKSKPFIFLDVAKNLSKQSARERRYIDKLKIWPVQCPRVVLDNRGWCRAVCSCRGKKWPRLFYRPSGHPMVNRSFSSHYYDYPMGWVRREAGKGMKKIWIHPLVRSQPVLSTYLGLPSALVLLCTPMRYVAYASTIEATKSNFSLLSTLLRHTPVSKEK